MAVYVLLLGRNPLGIDRLLARMFDPSQPVRDGWVLKGGYALEMPNADWAESEGVTFLPKPFSGNKLIAAVRRCLDGR